MTVFIEPAGSLSDQWAEQNQYEIQADPRNLEVVASRD